MPTLTSRGLAPERHVLSNGAVMLVKEARTAPAVAINLAFRAGSVYEPAALLGLAHFLSRVIDRGTTRRSAEAIAEDLDNRGVALNVEVSRHTMSLMCRCLADDFGPVLDVLADIARRPTFPDEEVAKRRGEIVTTLRQDEDSPSVRATEGLMESLFGAVHPYGRPSKGTVETIEQVTAADLVDFHRRRFAPSLISIAIVGAVEAGAAVDAVARAFGDWGAHTGPETDINPAPPGSSRRRLVFPMMNKVQADIAYGFTTVARLDPAYYAFAILNNVLGQYGLGGRLGENIRERQGMAYYAFSSLEANLVQGALLIRAGVSPANVDRAIAAIDDEVGRMAGEGVADRELREAQQYLTGSIPRMLETNSGIASFLQMVEFYGLGLDYDRRLPELLRAVSREDVNEAARRVLDPSAAAITVAGPYAGSLAPEGLAGLVEAPESIAR